HAWHSSRPNPFYASLRSAFIHNGRHAIYRFRPAHSKPYELCNVVAFIRCALCAGAHRRFGQQFAIYLFSILMPEPFLKEHRAEFRFTAISAIAIAVVAYALIAALVMAVPHLPLANKRTFYGLLRAQMAVDVSGELPQKQKQMVLFLGSSVVERG